jgi:hypothetical protein
MKLRLGSGVARNLRRICMSQEFRDAGWCIFGTPSAEMLAKDA